EVLENSGERWVDKDERLTAGFFCRPSLARCLLGHGMGDHDRQRSKPPYELVAQPRLLDNDVVVAADEAAIQQRIEPVEKPKFGFQPDLAPLHPEERRRVMAIHGLARHVDT